MLEFTLLYWRDDAHHGPRRVILELIRAEDFNIAMMLAEERIFELGEAGLNVYRWQVFKGRVPVEDRR